MTKNDTSMMHFLRILANSMYHFIGWYCLLGPFAGVAQTVFHDSPPYLSQTAVEILSDQTDTVRKILQEQGFDPPRFDILKKDKDLYLSPDGHFNVYKWKDGHWENINRQKGMGYNFGAKKFVYNHQIHSYGGYGFWRTHGDVLRFEEKDSSWQLLEFTAGLKGGIARFTGQGLYVYGPLAYYIDLGQEKIYTIKNVMVPVSQSNRPDKYTLDLGEYIFKQGKAVFIDPQAQTVYTSDVALTLLDGGNLMQKKYFLHLKGDSLTSFDSQNKTLRRYSFPSITGPLFEAEKEDNSDNMLYFLSAGALMIITGFSLWIFRKKGQYKIATIQSEKILREETIRNIIEVLVSGRQRQFSSLELDETFQRYFSTPSASLRARRIQCIQEVNKMYMNLYGKELITKSPDPNDGRKNIYELNP